MKGDFTVHMETIEHCKLFWIICSYQWKLMFKLKVHFTETFIDHTLWHTHTAHPAASNLLMWTLAFSQNMLSLLSNFWQNLNARNNEEQYSEFCLGLNVAQNSIQAKRNSSVECCLFFPSWIYTSSYLSPWHDDLPNLPMSVS